MNYNHIFKAWEETIRNALELDITWLNRQDWKGCKMTDIGSGAHS